MSQAGKVYLIGAGPGDPELITVKGLRALRRADVVVYDRLVNEELLDEAPEWAERVYVGKAPGRHTLQQEEINALLVERALDGLTVVRLKGGDPFVFGRGGEEALACAGAGVPWEVVPGISSAIAVPASAGIPVTHRGVAGSFAVVTAHRAEDGEQPDWEALARLDTLVLLMGIATLRTATAALIAYGRSPATPAAIIERGTLPDERVTIATLGTLAEAAAREGVGSPATIIVGEVVQVREWLSAAAPRAALAA